MRIEEESKGVNSRVEAFFKGEALKDYVNQLYPNY